MNDSKYDLAILGQGAGAFAAAIKANELGIRTAFVGKNMTKGTLVGGTCVNVGCVPSKNLITVGSILDESEGDSRSFQSIKYGKSRLDFRKAIKEKDALVTKFRKEKYRNVLKDLEKVEHVPALAQFISKNEVRAGDKTITADKFIIATGARAKIPSLEGLDKVRYLTNEEALSLEELPDSMIVVGGRTLGLEFAQMYAHFGTKVTVLQRSDRILPEDEPEISDALKYYLEQEGISIYAGVSLRRVSQAGKMKVVNATIDGKKSKEFRAEQLLLATGRTPNTDFLKPEVAGVELDKNGFVKVNDEMQTSAANIWAAGDVVGEPMLEALAAKEGAVAVVNAFGDDQKGKKKRINFREVPSAVFTYPEVARVGLTDADANGQGIKCSCGILPFESVSKAHIIGDTRGLIKLVANRETKKIVGIHILSPHAADLIHEGVLAIKFGLTIDDIIDTVHVFPTLSESIKLAAQSFYRDVNKMSCCTE
ncbi:MAG: mercury(II) reductase [Thaumarchaeota archaeon]|nr:mercury(II) reductase [Nitrososphaerota archaeon]